MPHRIKGDSVQPISSLTDVTDLTTDGRDLLKILLRWKPITCHNHQYKPLSFGKLGNSEYSKLLPCPSPLPPTHLGSTSHDTGCVLQFSRFGSNSGPLFLSACKSETGQTSSLCLTSPHRFRALHTGSTLFFISFTFSLLLSPPNHSGVLLKNSNTVFANSSCVLINFRVLLVYRGANFIFSSVVFLICDARMHLTDEYPIKYEAERLPPLLVADLNGDGRKEVLVASHDAKIQVLKPRSRRVDEGFSEACVLAEASENSALWIYAILHSMHLLVVLALNDGAEKMRWCAFFFGLQYALLFG
ncbi:hypothetical protein RJT34_31465 [Clitoria ternatea]|uniref:Uncharacterized protein n=1 Tax=Clitoria ternatea TaxID=43366 RepID=A0AAN9EUC4_CLITE